MKQLFVSFSLCFLISHVFGQQTGTQTADSTSKTLPNQAYVFAEDTLSLKSISYYKELVLYKPGIVKKINYQAGDFIKFKVSYEQRVFKGAIQAIGDNFIVLRDRPFPISQITVVWKYDKKSSCMPLLSQAASKLPLAGIGYALMDLNQVLGGSAPFSWRPMIVSAALFATGVGIRISFNYKHKISKRKWLKIIDYESIRKIRE